MVNLEVVVNVWYLASLTTHNVIIMDLPGNSGDGLEMKLGLSIVRQDPLHL